MSSLSVCLSVDQSVVGGREGGEREVEVSLFEVLYYIVSPSLFPSFPFILFHPYLLFSVHKQLFFFSSKQPCVGPDLSACFQDHA